MLTLDYSTLKETDLEKTKK